MKNIFQKPYYTFGSRLDSLMDTAGLTNIKLSRLVNVDPSHISRFRNGLRAPKSNPELIDKMCRVLFDYAVKAGNRNSIIELTGIAANTSISDDMLYEHMNNWLCDFSTSDITAVHDMLMTIDNIPSYNFSCHISADSILTDTDINDNRCEYTGNSGLQEAVIRFLGQVLHCNAPEILLYSDMNMDWLTEPSYINNWRSLMSAVIRNGTRIKIIHNIERDTSELIVSIKNWLPLYMSGAIEAWYSRAENGNRFSHTLFLCPDIACISCFGPYGTENSYLYEYYTDSLHLNNSLNIFNHMLEGSNVLVNTSTESDETRLTAPSGTEFHNIKIALTDSSVTVIRYASPQIAFTFYHPLMCEAFSKFTDITSTDRNSR